MPSKLNPDPCGCIRCCREAQAELRALRGRIEVLAGDLESNASGLRGSAADSYRDAARGVRLLTTTGGSNEG